MSDPNKFISFSAFRQSLNSNFENIQLFLAFPSFSLFRLSIFNIRFRITISNIGWIFLLHCCKHILACLRIELVVTIGNMWCNGFEAKFQNCKFCRTAHSMRCNKTLNYIEFEMKRKNCNWFSKRCSSCIISFVCVCASYGINIVLSCSNSRWTGWKSDWSGREKESECSSFWMNNVWNVLRWKLVEAILAFAIHFFSYFCHLCVSYTLSTTFVEIICAKCDTFSGMG